MAYRNDSVPSFGAIESLKNPIMKGPAPRPIRLTIRDTIAEDNARIRTPTKP